MNILVTIPLRETQKKALESIAPEAVFCFCAKSDLTEAKVADSEIIIGNVPIPMLAHAEKLKWLQLDFAGSDNYAKKGVLPEGVILTNASGAYGLAISECMLAGILSRIKRLGQYQKNQEQHIWHNEGEVTSIEGSTTLVVGLGDIGSAFAMRMHALGSTVIGIRRHQAQVPPYVSALYQMDALDQLLPLADFVAFSLPNTYDTQNVMTSKQFELMKETAILVNVGRGTAICTDDLCKALCEHRIGGAVLDVVNPEPLPADHPLWDAPNLTLTPHVTGNFNLPETQNRVVNIAARNLAAYLHSQPLENVVDFSTGYRKM